MLCLLDLPLPDLQNLGGTRKRFVREYIKIGMKEITLKKTGIGDFCDR